MSSHLVSSLTPLYLLLAQLDIGLNILSTYIGGNESSTTMSGTSMASPHTAGLLAYLLSLYPHKSFNPKVAADLVPLALQDQASPLSATSVYSLAYDSLPSWVSSFLPPPAVIEQAVASDDELAPTPPTLTPKQLKIALLALATENALIDVLPSGTPNLLIFNNATA